MAVPAAMLLSMTLFQGAAAQVKEQQTTTVKEGGIAPAKPAVDCQVTWDDLSWTKCSPQGTQSRRYTVDVHPTRAGKQCPAPEVRPCEYAGPQEVSMDWKMQPCAATRRSDRNLLGYTGETHEVFPIMPMCQYNAIKVTVGDTLVFNKADAADDVFAVASQWHYAQCDFSDGGKLLSKDADSTANQWRYTIKAEDKNKRLYLANSRAGACAGGQRILVSVDDFKQGTLAEALDLIDKKTYETEDGANHLVERIWCWEDHCPTPALGFYEGNMQWAKQRCVADAYSLLGFVYRKRPNKQVERAEKYYKKALELVPTHCEATSYMGELYVQINDFAQATDTWLKLDSMTAAQNTAACISSKKDLEEAWKQHGWCPSATPTKRPCVQSAAWSLSNSIWSFGVIALLALVSVFQLWHALILS